VRFSSKAIEKSEKDSNGKNVISNSYRNNNLLIRISAFYVNNLLLYLYTKRFSTNSGIIPDYICAYECGGVIPTIKLKKKFPKSIAFGKFQGTVLGSVLDLLKKGKKIKGFNLELDSYSQVKYLDLCIMTDDGTKGDNVLEYFGVDKNKILFLHNGISDKIIHKTKEKPISTFSNRQIKLFTASRLIYWKRIPLAIKIMNKLKNQYSDDRFILNIYGFGNELEIQEITRLINQFGLKKTVFYQGPFSYDNVHDIYNENDILISLYMFSNVCNPVLESAYLGIPILTLYNKELKSLIGGEQYGNRFFDDSHDDKIVDDISKYLHALTNDDLFKLLSEAKTRSNLQYSWDERILSEVLRLKNLAL
jgi:glycosyltransferase involved in cell wall biosynthesis